MKKILLVTRPICPPWDEASKNFAYYLAKNIKDFEFGLLTNGIIPDLPDNIKQKAIYTSNNFSYLQKIRLIKNLRKFKNDFDILHYIFTPTKQNSFLIRHFVNYGKRKDIRSIQTIATLREDLYSDKELKNLIFGDLIITYSDHAKEKLNSLGFNNVKRVYPGIDLELYKPMPKDLELMKQLKISEKDFVLTYHGEFTRLGSIDDISEMVEKYQKEFREKNIKVVFACRTKNDADKNKKSEMIKNFEAKKLMDIVRLPETFTTMEKVYNLGDVALFPVHNMQGKFDIPLVVPEAMACQKPVIISDLPILKELAEGGDAVIIQKGNMESIYDAIMDLYSNPQKREAIGIKARKYVEENFDIKKVAEIYNKIYEIL